MKQLFMLTIFGLTGAYSNREVNYFDYKPVENRGIVLSYEVTATMYYAEAAQCDDDFLVTAGMYKINPEMASEHKFIALSRNLLARWGGVFHYGDMVKLEGTKGKDGVYMVADCMARRFKDKIDILETKGKKFYKFDKVKITKL